MIRGDALRGAHRSSEAIAAYARAIDVGDPTERAIAGLAAARLLAAAADRRTEAARALERSGALAAGSPVRGEAEQLAAELAADE